MQIRALYLVIDQHLRTTSMVKIGTRYRIIALLCTKTNTACVRGVAQGVVQLANMKCVVNVHDYTPWTAERDILENRALVFPQNNQ